MREVSIHSQAEREMLEAMAWYDAEQQGISAAIVEEVIVATEQIVAFPESGLVVRRGIRRKTLRRFPYNLIYRVTEAEIRILAFEHQRRRSFSWINRR